MEPPSTEVKEFILGLYGFFRKLYGRNIGARSDLQTLMIALREAGSAVPKYLRTQFDEHVTLEPVIDRELANVSRLAAIYGVDLSAGEESSDWYGPAQRLIQVASINRSEPDGSSSSEDEIREPPYTIPRTKGRGRDVIDRRKLYFQLKKQFPARFTIEDDVRDAYPDANYGSIHSIIEEEWLGSIVEDAGRRGHHTEYKWRNTW